MTTIQVTPSGQACGASVSGIDLTTNLSDKVIDEIRNAWLEHHVLAFPDQPMTDDDLERYTVAFGGFGHDPYIEPIEGRTNVIAIHRRADETAPIFADSWHSDWSFQAEPPAGTCLLGLVIPPVGGDTLYADMALAYDLLSEPIQRMLEGLTAVHDGALPYVGAYKTKPPEGGYPRSKHPVVTRHPETGRKILYVNCGFTTRIVGLSPRESRAILDMLFRHIDSTPKLYCRVAWQPGTLTFWDNRCTQHHAVWDYHPYTRRGERVSVVDGRPPSA